jgi:hypothetical protein
MKFRKLYWVTEQLDEGGRSQIGGVFTSIPDLIEGGIHWQEDGGKPQAFRLSLVKLDSRNRPLGCWTSPDYPGIEDDLAEYIRTQEFGPTEIEELLTALRSLSVPV